MELLQTLQRLNPTTTLHIDLEYKYFDHLYWFRALESLVPLMPILTRFKKLKELNLHGNRLKQLPEDLSALRSLESLDLSNNLFVNINSVITALQSLPNLVSLSYPLSSKEEENLLTLGLPKLKYLNNKELSNKAVEVEQQQFRMQDDDLRRNFDISMKQSDLEKVAIEYDTIRELFRVQNPRYDMTLQNLFDEHVRNVMRDLQMRMKPNTPDLLANTYILRAKYALQELCFAQIIEYVQSNSQPQVASVLQQIHDEHAQIFKDLTGMILHSKDLMPGGREEDDPNSGAYQNLRNEIQSDNQEQQQTIQMLEGENRKFLDMIIRYGKGDKTAIPGSGATTAQKRQEINESLVERSESFGNMAGMMSGAIDPPSRSQYSPTPSPQPNAVSHHHTQSGNSGISGNEMVLPTRHLTLKQIKDVIFEIYESKAKFDQKYQEAKLPRETMEQHMYTFLNQKYGLKNLIIEWASAIIAGIKKYSHEDNDIAVFGKILRNECDEEFRLVQARVKNTIQELLKMYIRGKHPLKHQQEVKELMQQKLVGWVMQDEAVDIVKYMYNQEDSEELIEKMKPHFIVPAATAKKLSREEQLAQMQERERPKIEYWLFQKLILDFQLRSHEKYLRRFIQLFRTVDQDHNGIINEPQFRQLTHMMNIELSEVEIQKYLSIVDPYDHQQITFSQAVTLFSQETVQYGKTQISILQKIIIDF